MFKSCSGGSFVAAGDRQVTSRDDTVANLNTNKWTSTATTMGIAATQASGLQFNSGGSVAATVGIMLTSNKFFERPARSSLIFRAQVKFGPQVNGSVAELGFGAPATATQVNVTNGVFWRRDSTGQFVPIFAMANNEIQGTTVQTNTFQGIVPITEYCIVEVELTDTTAFFRLITLDGKLISDQSVEVAKTQPDFPVTRIQAYMRLYNQTATLASPAPTIYVINASVSQTQQTSNKPWAEVRAGDFNSLLSSPLTAFAQIEQYANNAAPTTGTPTNTTAAVGATFGGQAAWNNAGTSFGASDTLDLVIFNAVNTAPFGMQIKGIKIDTVSLGAVSNAAVYTIQYFYFVSSTVSLASTVRRKVLGFQTLPGASAIGTVFSPPIDVRFENGIYVMPGRFFGIGARVIGASVGVLNQVIRTMASYDGYFE